MSQPDEYITIFSLRNWGKLRGDILTTEQVSHYLYRRNVDIENVLGLYSWQGPGNIHYVHVLWLMISAGLYR